MAKPRVKFRNPESKRREKKELGKRGEEVALRFLKKKGYRLIEKNYVCKMGEMDIIAKEKDTLVFIEVKTRTSALFGPPQLAVNAWKQRQLSKVALNYLNEKRLRDVKARFDVVAIVLEEEEEEIELIKDAFDLQYP
jgi:putative endonuclease